MYLSEEKRAEIQKCFENKWSDSEFKSGKNKENHISFKFKFNGF